MARRVLGNRDDPGGVGRLKERGAPAQEGASSREDLAMTTALRVLQLLLILWWLADQLGRG